MRGLKLWRVVCVTLFTGKWNRTVVAMTTFDLAEVRGFAEELDAKMDRCDNNEGMECATLDAALLRYAELCCSFCDAVRQWARAVFAGRVPYDREVERAWQTEGLRLYRRASQMWGHGRKSEGQCYILEGRICLQAALWEMYRLLTGWVSPKLAVGPSARQASALNSLDAEEVRQRVASLAPLPANWQPDYPSQCALYQKEPSP